MYNECSGPSEVQLLFVFLSPFLSLKTPSYNKRKSMGVRKSRLEMKAADTGRGGGVQRWRGRPLGKTNE